MSTYLIVGANRGIGLELCRQLAQRGETVMATCRSPSDALAALGVEVIDGINVGDDHAGDALAERLAGRDIDVLIHNAGILRGDNLDGLDLDAMREQFEVNALGPLRVVRSLRDRLRSGAKIGIVSSRVGSIDDNGSGGNYGYRVSKVAVNMIGKNLSHDLGAQGVAVVLLHPGLVATDMTGQRGITPTKAAAGLIERMDALTMSQTGTFWHAEGYELPW